ncbi:hypothetical protein HME9302_01866 [Alteripontixanthobacter maritimus]|uniref:Energy transducer TonB n=1 Tax=Alteripontixanthobacter maritimus TaxID=2161824 RepID=A0A369Q717_9SPHN|nr:energy transducer TonB [Alteripontixanthobacter maritimus]RDC60651.1 hypothetical protein HME9302_01866 [Alteripontixanthobacter maritimus]
MAARTLRSEEAIALGIAFALHLGLAAVLLTRPEALPKQPEPERIVVSLATEVGLASTAPEPVPESRAPAAPDMSPQPIPAPVTQSMEAPPQPVIERPVPQPKPRTRNAPTKRAEPPKPKPAAKPKPQRRAAAKPAAKPPTASRKFDDAFAGAGQSATSTETRAPAATFGAAEQAQLSSAINRALKPHWRAPQGVDADRLVTVLSWRMNPDGSLAGTPRVVSQSGINDSNRPQAALHAEQAIRAVQLAAPFNLPDEFYDKWKRINDWRFDRRL